MRRKAQAGSEILQVLVVVGAAAAAVYARMAFSPVQEAAQAALSLHDNEVALLQGPALALPLALGIIPLGMLVDRNRRARLLRVFALLVVAGTLATAWAPNLAVLFAARSLIGLAAPATVLAAISMLADLCTPAGRGRAMTVMSIGQIGGSSAAFALGGTLLAAHGAAPDAWRLALTGMIVPLIGVFLLLAFVREPPRTGAIVAKPSPREAFVEVWRYRAVVFPLIVGGAMVGMADAAVLTWASPMLTRAFGMPPDQVGAVMGGVVLVGGLAGSVLGGPMADFCQRSGGPHRTVVALSGLAALSVPASLFGVSSSAVAASVLLGLFLTIGIAIAVMGNTLMTVALPNEVRGLCIAISAAVSVPFIVGVAPMTVSLLSGVIGGSGSLGTALSLVCAGTSALGAATFALARRHLVRATAD